MRDFIQPKEGGVEEIKESIVHKYRNIQKDEFSDEGKLLHHSSSALLCCI